MPISTNGTVIARLAGGLYNTVLSNATYLEVATQDPSTLANTLYSRDFAKSTDLSVATTLLANLGLSAEAGLDAWVAAQLTAAGAANKGAKIVSLLNDFAGLTADAKWGTYATSFNTKVDAALAASQKAAAVTGVFATAGSVAVANATFTLTTATDTGAAFTGGAGDDTFNATNADLGVLDSIDGGAGTNTLNITDSVNILKANIAAKNIQTVNVTSTLGSVGSVTVASKIAAKETVTYEFSTAAGTSVGVGPVKVTVGGASKTVGTETVATAQKISAIVAAINELAGATIASTTAAANDTTGVITVASATAGVALPEITFADGTFQPNGQAATALVKHATGDEVDTTPGTNGVFKTTLVANQAASDAVTASTFAVPTGATTATISAKTSFGVSAPTTAALTVSGTGGAVSGGASQTITGSNSVNSSGSTGAVKITLSSTPATLIAAQENTGWSEAAGVFVQNGTTVSVTEKAGTYTAGTTTTAAAGQSTKIQIGANPADALGVDSDGAVRTSTSTGFPEAVGNISTAPTGDVTTSVKTTFTDYKGISNVTYGTNTTIINMNGGTTANVTGAKVVVVRDVNTILTNASSTADALPGTSKLTTVNLTGVAASGSSANIYSDALTNLSVVDSNTTVTVNSNTGKNTGTLNLSVGNSDVTVSASNATTVAVTGVQSSLTKWNTKEVSANNSVSNLTLTAAKATAVSFAGSSDINLLGSTLSAATTINASGSGKLSLGTVSNYTKVTSVDASAATGAITASIGLTVNSSAPTTNRGLAFTTGSGNDVITLTGEMKSGLSAAGAVIQNTINLGAGNDTLLSSSGAIGAGATVDGGAGNDTISSTLLNAGNSTRITNFEVLGLAQISGNYDVTLLSGATGLSAQAFTSGTYTGVKTTQGLTYASNLGSGTTTLDFGTTVATGTADSYAVTFAGVADASYTAADPLTITGGTLAIPGIENISITSSGTGNVKNALVLTATDARTVTITGDKEVSSLTFSSTTGATGATATNGLGLALIDGSAATGKLTIDATGVASANFGYTGLSIKGGSNKDTITIDKAKTTVDAGAGDDVIIVGAASTTLTGGAGADTFDLRLAKTGTTSSSSSTVITTITDYSTADTLQVGNVSGAAFAKYTPTGGTDIYAVIDAALGATAVNASKWFNYGGDTYIVVQDSSTSVTANDIVVKLVGTFTLTPLADTANATGLIGIAS